jgi:hypothetical protein
MVSSGLLRRVALVRTDVSEEPGASFIRVTKIGALGTTHGVTTQKTQFFIVTAVKTSNPTKNSFTPLLKGSIIFANISQTT